jgi:insulysin
MMRLEIVLTTEGFANRSAIIAAIYDSLQSVLQVTGGTFRVPDGLLKRYLSMARLFGYYIAPRPPDAIDLAVDAQTFGVGGSIGVGVPGVWPLLPEGDDPALLDELRKGIGDVLRVVVDPKLAIIIVTASNQAILESWRSIVDSSIPMPLSSKWQIEPLSRARYLEDDLMSFPGFVEEWIANRFIAEDEISPPVYNPLMPTRLRHPRPERVFPFDSREDSISERFATKTASGAVSSLENSVTPEIGQTWLLYQSTASGQSSQLLPVPMMPEELTPRCAVVVQLLSSRPPRATVKQAASAQLWLVSFEKEIQDLVSRSRICFVAPVSFHVLSFFLEAELGGPAGLAYDISFNKYGLRICFLGISQNVLAYARRFCGRLVRFPSKLMVQTDFGPSVVEKTVTDANRQRSLSPMRRRRLESEIREASSQDAAREAKAFLASCTGAIFFVQGDVLPNEALNMAKNIKEFFDRAKGRQEEESTQSATPEISEILYRPQWRPRSAAICSIPGVPLISDACGRIPR